MEAILQGWLTKSPPEKKQFKLFGSKWRKRYFVLYAPPTVAGFPDACTAILEYYSSKKLHNKCGTINLSDCEEVLSNLDSEMFQHVFGLRTMHKSQLRTYYLAADTEVEMNKWVNRLCQVLGLTENDDTLSPQLQQLTTSRPGLSVRSLHMTTQPLGIPASTRQTFQPRPLTHQSNFGPSSGGLLSPAPPPLRPVPSTPAAPFSRLNISEPNLIDAVKAYPENGRVVADDGLRMTSPPGSSRLASPPGVPSSLRSAGSFPELDRFSPTSRKPGHLPGEGREFMELPPIPPEKAGPKVALSSAEPIQDAAYDQPKQKYYERSNTEENEAKNKHHKTSDDDWYNSPPTRYNAQPPGDNSFYNSPPSRYNAQPPGDDGFYNSPPSRYNSVQPPKADSYNMVPPNKYKSMGGDPGLGRSEEGLVEEGHDWYNVPQNASETKLPPHSAATLHQDMRMQFPVGDGDVPPAKPRRFVPDTDDCYNVPRPSAGWSDRQTGGVANWTEGHRVNGSNWNEQEDDDGLWNSRRNFRREDSEDSYNVPRSLPDKKKHVSQGEEFYNIPKSQTTRDASCNLPRQKSDRRSYGGRGCRSSHDPSEEDYDTPALGRLSRRPESGHGDLGLYNIPGLSMSSVADDSCYNRPQSIWERDDRQMMPSNGTRRSDAPSQAQASTEGARESQSQVAGHGRSSPYNVPPVPSAAAPPAFSAAPPASSASSSSSFFGRHLQTTDASEQPASSNLSLNAQTLFGADAYDPQKTTHLLPSTSGGASHSTLLPSAAGDNQLQEPGRVEMEAENEKSSGLKKTPSGAFKQNKSVQSSTSIHKKQQQQPGLPGLPPLHDSIRFTQRTKSFKRSIPSQDRSTLPLPVKRIVERSESSSSSTSDDESDHNNSTHSTTKTHS